MAKFIKRKKKRKIIKRFENSFEVHPSGFRYQKVGCLYVFPYETFLLVTIRDGADFHYSKRCNFGTTLRWPRWVTEGLRRRECRKELHTIKQISKYVKDQIDGNKQAHDRQTV